MFLALALLSTVVLAFLPVQVSLAASQQARSVHQFVRQWLPTQSLQAPQ